MIGAAVSMHYFGKKSWGKSIIFWAVVLVCGIAAASILQATLTAIAGAAIFIGLAHYWYKLNWIKSIVLFAIAFIIDLLILMVLGITLLAFISGILH